MKQLFCIMACVFLAACNSADPFDELDMQAAPASTRIIDNSGISLRLEFMDKLVLPNGKTKAWSPENEKPYILAAKQWLSALVAVDGVIKHEVAMKIWVQPLNMGNGVAGPDEEIKINGLMFPLSGSLIIGSHTYEAGFDPIEFHANILHEMGHIWGIGSFTEEYIEHNDSVIGNGFKVAGGVAVSTYNRLYAPDGPSFSAVPFSDDGGHLYDYKYQEDKRRLLGNGDQVPPLTQEFMANGVVFGVVTLAVLDDIGYVVNYSAAETYTPK